MISREVIKAEIDNLEDQSLELSYKIIKAMVTPTDIWERSSMSQQTAQPQNGSAFLLSIAGMFDSGVNDTSKRADTIVADMIVQKYQGPKSDGCRPNTSITGYNTPTKEFDDGNCG